MCFGLKASYSYCFKVSPEPLGVRHVDLRRVRWETCRGLRQKTQESWKKLQQGEH